MTYNNVMATHQRQPKPEGPRAYLVKVMRPVDLRLILETVALGTFGIWRGEYMPQREEAF